MALVQVQRSPSSSNSSSTISISEPDDESDDRLKKSCSSFFAVKGAALFLPRGAECRPIKKNPVVGDLQVHLQSMFILLRPQDSITLAVRLESILETRIRYLILVSCMGVEDTEENIILGVDIVQRNATIGLVLPVWADTEITLDGDGGFTIKAKNRLHIFKPVSVQAMWSALQALNKSCENARKFTYFSGGLNLTWTGFYESRILSNLECIREWNVLPDITSHKPVVQSTHVDGDLYRPNVRELTERLIVVKLREVLMNVDIEEVTSKQIRTKLEEAVGNNLKEFKPFIDEQMLIILRQMDSPTQIFDFLYLGSEWNAGNLSELELNGVSYILNVTKEIDNFFPGRFKYHNIRLYDVESSDLLRHWEDTHRFLAKAKETGSKVLVHCKMGVSRSAATVIAFAMKENRWNVEKALNYVKSKRKVINPNKGFRQQLAEYQGILDASDQRHNKLWRSKSESSLSTASSAESNLHVTDIHLADIKPAPEHSMTSEDMTSAMYDPRRRSWSPNQQSSEDLLGPSPEVPSVSKSATQTPMYLDSPTATNAGAGFVIGEGGSDTDSNPEELADIQIVVPDVPLSPIKDQDNHFPPSGYVSQKIFSIEGVTTSESTEEAEKNTQNEEEVGMSTDQGMKEAEEPGKFLVEGAITEESTEDDIVDANKELSDVDEGEGIAPVEVNEPSDDDDDDDETLQLDAPIPTPGGQETEEGRRTPVNFPVFLPLAEGRYMFPLDMDAQSVTSSCAVTMDDDDDDYIRKANFEDEDITEEEEDGDNITNMQGGESIPDKLESPDDKDTFFTPDESPLPVLGVPEPNDELMELQESSPQMDDESEIVGGVKQDKEDVILETRNDDDGTEVAVDTVALDAVPSVQELQLDIDESLSLELNTNNNSSNENSPRDQTVVMTPVTKDSSLFSREPKVKSFLSPLERRNISLSSSSPESPDSDGYKTASSDTAETPTASPVTSSSKEYSMGYVRSRARCYETQISADSEDLSVNVDSSKAETPAVTLQITNVEEVPDNKTPIPHKAAGSVLRQMKDIEERLKTESDNESSPPVVRSTKILHSGNPKESSKLELSPPPIDKEALFASPSLQSLEKGIVKKLTKQLLSNEPTLTKEDTKVVRSEPQLADVVLDISSTMRDNNNAGVITNQGESEAVEGTEIAIQSTSETLQEQSTKGSDIKEQQPLTELVFDKEAATVQLREKKDVTKYSKFGDEKIPLQPGIVKRHTQDYEQMSAEKLKEELEKMEKAEKAAALETTTSASTVEDPVNPAEPSLQVTSNEGPDVSDKTEEVKEAEVQSAYPEEGSHWCVGDVKKHKKVFEVTTDAEKSALLDSGIPFTVQTNQETWDKKLTQEELENIKELGKIVLGRSDDISDESEEEEEEVMEEEDPLESDPDGEVSSKFIAVNERIRKLEMRTDKPKPSHIDLKRSSSIARMSSEKISPQSARRRYERRKVIIRSKSDMNDDETPDVVSQPTIAEMERQSATSSVFKGASGDRATGATSISVPKDTHISKPERLRSKSEGQKEEQSRTSYVETFDDSTQDAAINMVLNQAHTSLLENFQPGHTPGPTTLDQLAKASPSSGPNTQDQSAQASPSPGSSQKRKKNHGNSHPLSKLTAQSRNHPFYSTM